MRLAQALDGPFGGPPVQDLPLPDKIRHRPNRLGERHGLIVAVAEIQVQVIAAQTPQRRMARVEDVLAAQPP